jgi:hypothetical protein
VTVNISGDATYDIPMYANDTSGYSTISLSGTIKEASGAGKVSLRAEAYLNDSADATKTTSARGIIELGGYQSSGGSLANTAGDGNVLVVHTQRGGSNTTLLIVDEDGDLHIDGTTTPYDAEDDMLLVRELAELLAMTPAQRRDHVADPARRRRVETLGLAHADERGIMVSSKRHASLLRGALMQLDERLLRIEEALTA